MLLGSRPIFSLRQCDTSAARGVQDCPEGARCAAVVLGAQAPEIRKAHEEGLLLGDHVDYLMEEVDDNRTWGLEMGAPQLADTGAHFLIGNTLEEIGGYSWFSADTRLGPEGF